MSGLREAARAVTASGDELVLRMDAGSCEIRMNGQELMSSRGHASEDALGRLACAGLGSDAVVLIGGLGLGYTLRAALDALPEGASVVVVELLPEIVGWVRGPLAPFAGDPLADQRVSVIQGDVACVLRASEARFDAVVLDIDNGPDGRVRAANAWPQRSEGLAMIRRALRRPGLLALWSADPAPRFESAARAAGFALSTRAVAATEHGGPLHTIHLAHLIDGAT